MERADSIAGIDKTSKNKLSIAGTENSKNIFENIETVYRLCYFYCIINWPYEVTTLFILANLLYIESALYGIFFSKNIHPHHLQKRI